MEVVAHRAAHPVAEHEVPVQRRPAQVEVPVLEPGQLVHLDRVLDRKRQRARLVEDPDLGRLDLDRSRREPRVRGPLRPGRDHPAHGEDELAPDRLGARVGVATRRGIEHALGEPGAVAEVDEAQPAVVAAALGPAHQRDAAPGVRGPELAARVRARPAAERVDHGRPPSARSSAARPASGTARCAPDFISRTVASPRASSSSPTMTATATPSRFARSSSARSLRPP